METLAYRTIPKMLDTDQVYKKMSVEAKYLYSYMRDLFKLSVKNKWQDKKGIFIKLTREKIGELLGRSLPTVRKILKELVKAKLIIDIRLGLTLCNKIYVQLLPGETIEDFQTRKNQGFTTDRNDFTPNKNNPSKELFKSPYREPMRERKPEKRRVTAQQYNQREYTREELNALFDNI